MMEPDYDGPYDGPNNDDADLPDTPVIANIEAEAALLGGIMSNNSVFEVAIEYVTATDFYEPVHQRIFSYIQDQISLGKSASAVTLKPLLKDDPDIGDLGGPGYLSQLTAAGLSSGAKDFAEQIADLSKLRKLHDSTADIIDDIRRYKDGVSPAKYASRLESAAFNVTASKHEQQQSFTIAESIRRANARVTKVKAEGKPTGATAPDIPQLEEAIGPLERGHLHVWAGRPGMGKSALMCGAARSMAANGHGVGVFSLEMSDIDLGQRFAADVALSLDEKVLHASIRDAKLTDREQAVLEWAAEKVDQMPLKIEDCSGISLARLFVLARKMKRELEAEGHTLDVIFVDYLQLLSGDGKFDNKVGEITYISQGLKRLAKELKCAVVALSQLSRQVEQREIKIPHLSDLRDSGSIEQDADTVLFVYREFYYLQNAEPDKHAKANAWEAWRNQMEAQRYRVDFICAKRRGGETARRTASFLPQYSAIRGKDFWHDNAGGMFNE